MSSIGCSTSDEGDRAPAPTAPLAKDLKITGPSIKGRSNEIIEKDKFLSNCEKTFQTTVSHNAVIKKKEHVLVAFSGGASSRMMLHLLHEISSLKRVGARMIFTLHILHIDEGAVFDMCASQREANVAKVENICQQYPKTPLSVVSLEESVFPAMEKGAAAQALKDYLLSFKSLSAKEDAYRQLIQHAILGSTVKLGFAKVATGESGNNLAVRTISNISKGRGFTVSLASKYEDGHLAQGNVAVLRPMKDFLNKEIAYYNHVLKLEILTMPSITSRMPMKTSSIDRLVENFLNQLQTDFPATVHTLLRTAEKLKVPIPKEDAKYCALCNDFLTDKEAQELGSYLEMRSSQDEQLVFGREEFIRFCCYGCKRQLSSKNSALIGILDELQIEGFVSPVEQSGEKQKKSTVNVHEEFPIFVGEQVMEILNRKQRQVSQQEMKEQIKDFLLDE